MTGSLLSSTVLILVIIGLRYAFGRKISLRIRYALWLLVALRLLIPLEIGSSPLSLQNFTAQADPPAITEHNTHIVPSAPVESVSPTLDHSPEGYTPPLVTSPTLQTSSNSSAVIQPTLAVPPRSIPWSQIAIGLWALGAGVMALWFLTVNLRFRQRAKKNAYPMNVEVYPFPVYINEELPSPCLVGLIRPRVYNPRETDDRTLRHILIHEQTHHRHLDPLWAGVRGLCLCLYWFHPLVWWAAILSRQDCELACDEGALQTLGEQERIPYGDTLLSMISHASHPQRLLRTATTMAASKNQLRERVEMIVKQPKKLWFVLLCLLLLISLTVGCTFTGANKKDFISPTSFWCSAFSNLIARSVDDTYDGDIESLQRTTALLAEYSGRLETLEPESHAYALLQNTLQIADLLEKEVGESFFDLPQWEQEALLELWYLLGNANYATSEEEYLDILEANAGSWLDLWIFGSTGHILPVENPVLPPSMPPKEAAKPTTPTKDISLDTFVEPYYEENSYQRPQTELTLTPGCNLMGYTIESLPNGNPLGVYATDSDFRFGCDGIYEDPYPSGQVGPMYEDSPELLKVKEDNLRRYLTLLLGEGDYTFQYDEAFSIKTPSYTADDLTVYGTAEGVNITVTENVPLTELTPGAITEIPVIEAALHFADIHAPMIQQRITYENTIDPTAASVKDYRYTVVEAAEYPSAILSLCKSINITYDPQTSNLRMGITNTTEPSAVATAEIPCNADFMEAVGDRIPETDRYTAEYVECYYSSQVVLGYLVPCYRVYIHNNALSEHCGIPTYTVFDLCSSQFPTNRSKVLPWNN